MPLGHGKGCYLVMLTMLLGDANNATLCGPRGGRFRPVLCHLQPGAANARPVLPHTGRLPEPDPEGMGRRGSPLPGPLQPAAPQGQRGQHRDMTSGL